MAKAKKPEEKKGRPRAELVGYFISIAQTPEVVAHLDDTETTSTTVYLDKRLRVVDAVKAKHPELTFAEIAKFLSVLEGMEKYFA